VPARVSGCGCWSWAGAGAGAGADGVCGVVVVSLGGSGAEGVAGAGAGEGWVPVRSGLVGGGWVSFWGQSGICDRGGRGWDGMRWVGVWWCMSG
jgi:hypothetical protein